MIITGTGSRSLALWSRENKDAFFHNLVLILQSFNPSLVVSGGAEGFDHALAKAAEYLSIPYFLALPNTTYLDYYWVKHSLTKTNRFKEAHRLITNASGHHYVCGSNVYIDGIHSNFIRNSWMIHASDHVLTPNIAKRNSPGTNHGLNQAFQFNKPVTRVDLVAKDN